MCRWFAAKFVRNCGAGGSGIEARRFSLEFVAIGIDLGLPQPGAWNTAPNRSVDRGFALTATQESAQSLRHTL